MRLIPCAIFESVPENIDYKRAQGSGLMVQGAGNRYFSIVTLRRAPYALRHFQIFIC